MNEPVDSKYSKNIKNIWCDTVEKYEEDKEPSWYEMSDNIVGIPLDAVTGKKSLNSNKTNIYYFKKGSEPHN